MNSHRRRDRLSSSLLLVALACAAGARADDEVTYAESTVDWIASYSDGARLAREEGKPILLKFYADWCPHCTKMDEGTWQDESIGELSRSFIPIRLNGETSTVALKRYHLGSVPLTIVAEPHGMEVFRLEGQANAQTIAAFLGAYLAHADELATSFARLRDDKKDAGAHLAIGNFYERFGLHDDAARYHEAAMKHGDGDVWLDACAGAAIAHLESDRLKKARKLVDEGLERAGDEAPPALLLAKGRVEAGLEDTASARAWLERVVTEHAGSPEARTAERVLDELVTNESG